MCCVDIPAEAVRFFVRFSQFEYALKRIGYAEQNGSHVNILWDDFLAGKGDISASGNRSIDYYFNNPPAEFVLANVSTSPWQQRRVDVRDNKSLLRLLRNIRNNLFHGEKPELVFGGSDADLNRSKQLLIHGNVILEELMKLEPRIFHYIGH